MRMRIKTWMRSLPAMVLCAAGCVDGASEPPHEAAEVQPVQAPPTCGISTWTFEVVCTGTFGPFGTGLTTASPYVSDALIPALVDRLTEVLNRDPWIPPPQVLKDVETAVLEVYWELDIFFFDRGDIDVCSYPLPGCL